MNDGALQTLFTLRPDAPSRFPIDLSLGAGTLLPHCAYVKSFVQLLRFNAIEEGEKTNHEEAVRSVLTSLALARTLRNEPIVISELVRLASVSISVDGLQYVLSTFQLTGGELAALDGALATAEKDASRGLWRGLVGERAIGLDTFNLSYKQLERYGMNPPGQSDGIFDIAGVIAFNVHHLSGLHDADRTIYLDSMQDIIDAATNRFPEMLAASRAAMNKVDHRLATGAGGLAFVSRMLLPSLTNTVFKEAAVIAEIRSARIALEVEKYRLEHSGSLPENLAILNSSKSAGLSDPFDDKPFDYARLSKGYRIESRTARSEQEITTLFSTTSVHRKTTESAPKLGFTAAR
jgi:hypothetical protein